MNILFVDDVPDFKVKDTINYLETNKIKFSYNICKSINSALRYLVSNKNNINLIILDLGLPQFDDDNNFKYYYPYGGLEIIDEMFRKKLFNIPIIINSTTKFIPSDGREEKEYLNSYYSPIFIEHVDKLDGEGLLKFIKTYLNEKMELI